MLYEIAIVEHAEQKKDEDKKLEKLIFGPVCVVAKNDQQAAISVILDNAEKLANIDRDRMEVLVRPFA